jgi:hypothetical protein
MSTAPTLASPTVAARPRPAALGGGRVWHLYLVLTAVLIPFVHPIGPGQLAIGDVFNFMAIGVFLLLVLARGRRLELPFLGPVFLIASASLIATTNAVAPSQSFLTMIQDTYLYLWFVMLVNVSSQQGEVRSLRVAWMVTAAAISLYGVYDLMHSYGYGFANLVSPKGERASATFGNANFFADYLVVSFFVITSLASEVSWVWRVPAMGAVLLGLVASKSLGGLLSLVVALGVGFLVRAITRRTSMLALWFSVCVLGGLAVLGVFVVREFDIGREELQVVTSQSMVGRLDKSSESRLKIWGELRNRFEQAPLGIGPGNSSFIQLAVANRERRGGSILGKEAHNDYVGYLVERGPIALIGLLLLIALSYRRIARSWSAISSVKWRAGTAGVWAASLAAGLTASTAHSFTIEKLHFRHFWLFLAILCALSARMERRASERTSGSDGPSAAAARSRRSA